MHAVVALVFAEFPGELSGAGDALCEALNFDLEPGQLATDVRRDSLLVGELGFDSREVLVGHLVARELRGELGHALGSSVELAAVVRGLGGEPRDLRLRQCRRLGRSLALPGADAGTSSTMAVGARPRL